MQLLIDRFRTTSVLLNGVAIPVRNIEAALARYAFNVFILNDDDTFPVSMRGTGTAIRFDGRELFVCSQHQLDGINLEKVGMMAEGGGTLVTSGGTRYFVRVIDSDRNDLIAFNFSEPVAAHPQFRSRFFNLKWPTNLDTEVISYVVTGCAYADQHYDVLENNHIEVARRSIVCHVAADQPSDPALLRLESEAFDFKPDGMSGGSAFVVHRDESGYYADFAGMIVQAGGRSFNIIRAAVVYKFLEACDWNPLMRAH